MNDNKTAMQKALDFIFGKSEAHNVMPRMNRKQRRTQLSLHRKQQVAAKRRKHEKRG